MAAIPSSGTELQLAASMASPRASGSSNIASDQSIPPILTLPPEMIEMIGEAADPHDLLAARRSCKEICGALSKPFVKAYFTIRKHIVTIHSLSALIGLTAHPVFGLAIREIWISRISMIDTLFMYVEDQYGIFAQDHYVDLVTAFVRATDDHIRLGKNGASELLAQALINLRHLNVVVSLGLFQGREPETKGWGYQHACGMLPEAMLCSPETSDHRELLFSAIQMSRYPLRAFSMDSVGESDLLKFAQESGTFDDVCSQITELNMINQEAVLVDVAEINPMPFWLFERFPRLTNVHLENLSFARDILFFDEIRNCHLEHLQEFSLDNLRVTGDFLVNFLNRHSSTLRSLALTNIGLHQPQNWDHVFRGIFKTLRLQKLEVYNLRANCSFVNGEEVDGDYTEPPFRDMKYKGCQRSHYSHIEYGDTENKSVCVLRHGRTFIGIEHVYEGLKDLIDHFVPTDSIDKKYVDTYHEHF